ncbi:RNA-binding domain-containing protein [Lichtheimia hyalospora FSU 10163]|nr:RNA-binding domain-containing protein [Lichtheimia hyalospora FSU 10163]
MAYNSRSRYSRSPSPPRRRRRSPSYSRSRSPSYSSRSRSPRRSLSPTLTPKNTVLVTNLTRNVTADHVKEIFAQFGSVVKVDFPINHRLNTNTGRAYVEYESKEDMDKAISYMNGGQLDGKHLDVDVAPAHRSPSPPSHRRRYSPPPSRYRRGGRSLGSGRRGRDRYLPSRDRYSLSRSRSPIRRGRRYSSYSRSRSRSYSPRGRSYSRSPSYSRRRSYSRSVSSGRSYSPRRRRYSRSRSYDSRDYSSRSKSRSISPPRGRGRRSISPRR